MVRGEGGVTFEVVNIHMLLKYNMASKRSLDCVYFSSCWMALLQVFHPRNESFETQLCSKKVRSL